MLAGRSVGVRVSTVCLCVCVCGVMLPFVVASSARRVRGLACVPLVCVGVCCDVLCVVLCVVL